jgi:cytochrome c2
VRALGALPLLLFLASSCAPTVRDDRRGERSKPPRPTWIALNGFGKCAPCHTAHRGGPDGIGPNLFGAYGVRAASRPGYDYSPALRGSGISWNSATLDRFLENPRAVVPGTKMNFSGLVKPGERRAVIAFLKRRSYARR